MWGRFSGSRGQGRTAGVGFESGPWLLTIREFSAETLAAVVPGRSTEKQVEALLGKPWRTDAADEDEAIPESWDYRGKDADGIYLVHIEFDASGTTSLIVKVPEKTHTATPTVAKAQAGSGKP